MNRGAPNLAEREVHVWRVPLAADVHSTAASGLSPAERERASRFRSTADRAAYITRRVALRSILAGYTHMTPEALSFNRSRLGRESLAGPAPSWLDFSTSSSGSTTLIAVARGVRIGVDVEERKTGLPYQQLAAYTFGPAAQMAMTLAPDPGGEFLSAWTILEARIKLLGTGLAVTLEEGNQQSLLEAPGYLAQLDVGTGYIACLAASSELVALRSFDYDRWLLDA